MPGNHDGFASYGGILNQTAAGLGYLLQLLPLTSVVGVSEAMTLTGDILSSEGRTELLVPMYLYLLLFFFLYCYPIARATIALEKRFQVR